MALFRLKKNTEASKEAKNEALQEKGVLKKNVERKEEKKMPAQDSLLRHSTDLSQVLVRPRVTEKATLCAERGVYVFDISPKANKRDVFRAIKALYNVEPKKIRVAKVPRKLVHVKGTRNKVGFKSGGKKAYVYVREGDTIDIV